MFREADWGVQLTETDVLRGEAQELGSLYFFSHTFTCPWKPAVCDKCCTCLSGQGGQILPVLVILGAD